MIEVPEQFAVETIAREGAEGRRWIEALPSSVDGICDRWGLRPDGAVMHGYLAVVVPVRRGQERLALKVGWIDDENRHEALALSTWDGRGAVRLIEADPATGALLLERLDPATPLGSLPEDEAVAVAAELLRRSAVPAPGGIPTLEELARRWHGDFVERWLRFDRKLPRRIVDAARGACAQLGPTSGRLLANRDLHYWNVLRGEREPWLVIDPKPLAGDAEIAVAPLIWSRFDADVHRRFRAIVDGAGLDPERARGWAIAYAVADRFWALSMGFVEGADRCAFIASTLADCC